MNDTVGWGLFAAIVVASLALDLFVFNRHGKEPSLRTALGWSAFWIALGLGFNAYVAVAFGTKAAGEFLAAYLLEKSLSVDNLFVISVIFSYFAIPRSLQHRVLFWGVLGAVVTRGVAIGLGVEILHQFEWTTYLFGAFLVYTGYKLLRHDSDGVEGYDNPLVRLAKRAFRFTPDLVGEKFFVRIDGKLTATRLFLVLLVVESTDVLFAVDSIPAVLGLSRDAFIIYTSNVFAVLGLRALYFVLADVVVRFHYMKHGLAVLLAFVGVKMMLAPVYELPITLSLSFIVAVLTLSGVASALRNREVEAERTAFESRTHEGAPPRQSAPVADWGPVERVAALHRLPTFQNLHLDDLRDVAKDLYVLRFDAGDRVFAQGDPADALYVVLRGQVGIYKESDEGQVLLATLGTQESFGEVALFDDVPRTATVQALEDTVLMALAKDAFHRLGERRPQVLMEVIRVLSERLRLANER